MRLRTLTAALALAAAATGATAIPNPSLKWKTISTEHFDVHFHEGAEWTARQVAEIAEEIYPHITGLYRYEPKRCHFVILDTDDYANGAAYFYDNKIEIWATNLEFGFRGTTQWLRNVVTHEYTHVVSIQAGMKAPRWMPALYLQLIGFEEEKRPDVITGYPNAIISYPLVGAVVPPWWAEGVAQYQSPTLQTDCWDTHRDMILRAAVLDDRMLSYDEMGFLGHKSLGNEQVYDHGYGLVRYIAATYGPEAIESVNDELGDWNRLTVDGALKKVTGKKGKALYEDWRRYLEQRYEAQLSEVYANPRAGRVVNADGFMTHSPAWSPDGARVAFLSNKGSDYAGTALYVAGRDGGDLKRIKGASSRGAFSPDGKTLVYARHGRIDKYGAKLSDLYAYDLESRKERRLTRGARAAEPSFSPDGSRVVCVLNADGSHRLALVDAEGGEPRVVFTPPKGTQLYAPQFAPDGSRILFGIFDAGTRDIADVAADGSDFRHVLRTPNDERDARYTADGRAIVFASDRTGVFNIHRVDLAGGEVAQLTNVTGGAFTPDVSPADGAVAYAGYDARGYHVAVLDAALSPAAEMAAADYAARAAGEFDECVTLRARADETTIGALEEAPAAGTHDFAAASLASREGGAAAAAPVHGDAAPAAAASAAPSEPEPYKNHYTDWQFYPRLVLWDGVPRFGAFVASSEVLDRMSFFASGSYGTDGGFDAIVSFQLRHFFPVLFIDFYRFRQKYDEQVQIDDRLYLLDTRYDLWSADLGLRFEFADPYSLVYRNDISVWYSRGEYRVNIDPEYIDQSGVKRPDWSVGWKYFVGSEFYLEWYFKAIRRAVDADINPRGGREIRLRLMYARDELFTSGEFEYAFRPVLDTNAFGQYTLDWREYIALPFARHSLQFRGMASYIDNVVDDFFWVYMGGMDGLRGYTYYTLGGRAGALASLTWRFPIWRRINRQLSWLTFKDIYGGAFFEIANAWDDEGIELQGYKRAAGYELRLNMGSFYSYPTTIGLTGAYALDKAVFYNPLFPDNTIVNDPRWQYYFIMGFMF
jgi:Tol biopolymer transport system component